MSPESPKPAEQLEIAGAPAERICLISLQCARMLGLDGWRWYSMRAVEPAGSILVRGAVCHVRFTRGTRKGLRNWEKSEPGTDREVVLTRAQIEEFERAWETETGKCSECGGTKLVFHRWSAKDGATFVECTKCGGTGVARAPNAASSVTEGRTA